MKEYKTNADHSRDRCFPVDSIHNAVYKDGRYTLGLQNGSPCLIAGGRSFTLSCHPYEPCLYITGENGSTTAVHNAFDPCYALEAFQNGKTVESITGFKYDAKDFCRMVEYAADMVDIQIDAAEKVFGGREKKKLPAPENNKGNNNKEEKNGGAQFCTGGKRIIRDDPFYGVVGKYPDSEVDFCLVGNDHSSTGCGAHRDALEQACRELFTDGDEETAWHYDCGEAEGKRVETAVLFAGISDERGANYRGAFCCPPYGVRCSDKDFDIVNAALFPRGTDTLEVYEWTTDWSEYFDAGHEWWGALCYTVYDKALDRFVVIMASATD